MIKSLRPRLRAWLAKLVTKQDQLDSLERQLVEAHRLIATMQDKVHRIDLDVVATKAETQRLFHGACDRAGRAIGIAEDIKREIDLLVQFAKLQTAKPKKTKKKVGAK